MPGQVDEEPDPVVRDVDGDEYAVDEILNSRIDRRRNDQATGTRGCLQYQIKWTGYTNVNTRPEWYDYTEVENAADAVADFHHRYPGKPGPHASFVHPADWEPLEEWERRISTFRSRISIIEPTSEPNSTRLYSHLMTTNHEVLTTGQYSDFTVYGGAQGLRFHRPI